MSIRGRRKLGRVKIQTRNHVTGIQLAQRMRQRNTTVLLVTLKGNHPRLHPCYSRTNYKHSTKR